VAGEAATTAASCEPERRCDARVEVAIWLRAPPVPPDAATSAELADT
jgi:hypothetical protein